MNHTSNVSSAKSTFIFTGERCTEEFGEPNIFQQKLAHLSLFGLLSEMYLSRKRLGQKQAPFPGHRFSASPRLTLQLGQIRSKRVLGSVGAPKFVGLLQQGCFDGANLLIQLGQTAGLRDHGREQSQSPRQRAGKNPNPPPPQKKDKRDSTKSKSAAVPERATSWVSCVRGSTTKYTAS